MWIYNFDDLLLNFTWQKDREHRRNAPTNADALESCSGIKCSLWNLETSSIVGQENLNKLL